MSGTEELPVYVVDAFAKRAFEGNGAAVCLLNSGQAVPDDVKQKIATEMNLSETAFVSPVEEEEKDTFRTGSRFALRWFTPTCEVSLCGHATLASSAVLFTVYGNAHPCLEFETASGLLKAKRRSDGKIEIDLPAHPPSGTVDPKRYEGVVRCAVGNLPVREVALSDSRKLLVRLEDGVTRRQLETLSPSAECLLSSSEGEDLRGLIVTLSGGGGGHGDYDFVSRYFSPWLGIPEDPVTGSAHSVLAPYWSKVLDKKELHARQCSPRGGDLRLRMSGDRVAIAGDSVVVLRGRLRL